MRRPRTAVLAGMLAGLAIGAAPAAAEPAGSVTHAAGPTSATLQWDAAGFGIANPRLFVDRAGVRYDLTIVDICDEGCILTPDAPDTEPWRSSVKVADLDGDGEPEVLVDTFSGGAHCCVTTRLLMFDGTGYQPQDIAWRDVGYELRDADRDGLPELVGYDPRFAGAFTAFAASAFPARVLQVRRGSIVDATRRFPAVVRADARRRLHDLRHARRHDDVRGLLAAYVADLYTLGRRATARAELARARRQGRVSKRFPSSLLRRLRSWGYA